MQVSHQHFSSFAKSPLAWNESVMNNASKTASQHLSVSLSLSLCVCVCLATGSGTGIVVDYVYHCLLTVFMLSLCGT